MYWDTGLYTISVQRGRRAYALSQCTQQGEAHHIYLNLKYYFVWSIGRKAAEDGGIKEMNGILKRDIELLDIHKDYGTSGASADLCHVLI